MVNISNILYILYSLITTTQFVPFAPSKIAYGVELADPVFW